MTFLQGIISFISPCMLPMLPIYISYFSGHNNKKSGTFLCALSFVTGFSIVFSTLGLFAGSIGTFLHEYHQIMDFVCGAIIILLGLDFLEIIKIPFFKGFHASVRVSGIFSAFAFGVVFSISHAPCVGAFLGTALVTASAAGSAVKGILMLLSYSLGMGIPFIISALLTERLNALFALIKKNYKIINLICGIILIVIGIFMATGLLHIILH